MLVSAGLSISGHDTPPHWLPTGEVGGATGRGRGIHVSNHLLVGRQCSETARSWGGSRAMVRLERVGWERFEGEDHIGGEGGVIGQRSFGGGMRGYSGAFWINAS